MDGRIAFPWALVCSVPEEHYIPSLREFSIWLTSTLQEKAVHYGCAHRFDREPRAVFHTVPGKEQEVRLAYSTLHADYPEVIFVIHILPASDSLEYKLMKELTDKYDLIRQGILLDNAMKQFEGCDMKAVLGNIIQWINRRISRLVALEEKCSAKFTLRISKDEKQQQSTSVTSSLSMNDVIIGAVHKVLHGKHCDESQHARAVVQVSGYPEVFNEFEIAKIFDNFRVVKVMKNSGNNALVEFANGIQAVQAVIEYDRRWIDSIHSLSVIPTHPKVLREVQVALKNGEISSQPLTLSSSK